MDRYVFHFSPGNADGTAAMKELLGAKGAGLAEMARLGLSVPPGMTISTAACRYFLDRSQMPQGLHDQVSLGIEQIEARTGLGWGDKERPLLVSVRSGGIESMPGMMDSVLNIGLNEETVVGLGEKSGDLRFAYDCWRRMIQMYGEVVFGVSAQALQEPIEAALGRADVEGAVDLSADDWRDVIEEMQNIVFRESGCEIPFDPTEQLWGAIRAVFESWNSPRAQAYRRVHNIDDAFGTGVNIMTMVFGNLDERSASGVAFTRNPATGERRPYGEYLPRAQGEDVVGGGRTPRPLQRASVHRALESSRSVESLEESMPAVYAELCQHFSRLEAHYQDMLDIEFTVESGKLWILQIRRGMRTGQAAVRMALDMVEEGLISPADAVLRVEPERHVSEVLSRRIDPFLERPAPVSLGLAASPGAGVGRLVTGTAEAVAMARRGEKVVLCRPRTSTKDIEGFNVAEAVITSSGGLTSHAAVVARSLGLPCVCGAENIEFAPDGSGITVDNHFIARGELVTVDGTMGSVYIDALPLVDGSNDERMQRFLKLCDRHRRMEVRAVADDATQAQRALDLGAEGVGLCRTEELICSDEQRLMAMRRVLLNGEEGEPEEVLEELLRMHRHEVAQILRVMRSRPVTLRLLDAPLSRFLPEDEAEIRRTAEVLELEPAEVARRVATLQESNPMLGMRGCRLGVVYPALYAMQVQAIVEAARLAIEDGIRPTVEILLPFGTDAVELRHIVDNIETCIGAHIHSAQETMSLEIGAEIAVPRLALQSEELAEFLDFINFDLTDLTQLSWGMSEEDVDRYLCVYLDEHLVSQSPFQAVDRGGVGELMRMGVHRGRSIDQELLVGVYGEQVADASSVRFFESLDIDCVSVMPEEVPAARVAAARAFVTHERALAMRVEN